MFTFFNIEKRIGLKKLSSADLGKSSTSNQTHIGLFNEVLTFWKTAPQLRLCLSTILIVRSWIVSLIVLRIQTERSAVPKSGWEPAVLILLCRKSENLQKNCLMTTGIFYGRAWKTKIWFSGS